MAQWHSAKVTQRIDWNDHLFSLRFICQDFPRITAGQFAKVGIKQPDGKILSRPYSLVNSPADDTLELIAVPVEEGSLSPKLHKLQVGDAIEVMSPATGFLILDEVPAAKTLYLFATGTGVGPFLSILSTAQAWQQFDNIVLVYAVRFSNDLAYLDRISEWQKNYPQRFQFVPIVSRDEQHKGLKGRIPKLIESGEIEALTAQPLSPEYCQVMLCGNPDMIKHTIEVLEQRGLKKHLRRSPGQITQERYW